MQDFVIKLGAYTLTLSRSPVEKDELDFVIGRQFPLTFPSRPYQKGLKIVYNLADDKGIKLTLAGKSKHGNPVDFANQPFEAVSSDPAILSVTKDDTGTITVQPVGPIGTAQVQVTMTNDLVGNPPVALSGHFDVQVVAGAAATITFNSGDTFDLPDPS